jgi:hypothetical protein
MTDVARSILSHVPHARVTAQWTLIVVGFDKFSCVLPVSCDWRA